MGRNFPKKSRINTFIFYDIKINNEIIVLFIILVTFIIIDYLI
nr:hypothetical protein TDPV-348 [Oriental turtle dovepox virus]